MEYVNSIVRIKFLTAFRCLYSSLIWIGCVFLFIVNVSCTREERKISPEEDQRGVKHLFPQGVADNLYGIEKFQQYIDLSSGLLTEDVLNKALKVKTSKTGELAKVSSSTQGVFIDPEAKTTFINQYYFLDDYKPIGVETEDQKLLVDLLGKVGKFKGFPDTVYHIVPHLENNYLILYRLSDPKEVPYDELPISIEVGDKLATPLVGYPIDYCVAEREVNNNHEVTGRNLRKCGVPKTSAQYIFLDKNQKNVFNYLPKLDLFPKEYFLNGKWFFVKTIIESSNEEEIGAHRQFASANLINFVESGNSLEAVDATDTDGSCKNEKVTGFSIPVEWKEYEITRDSEIIKFFGERETNVSGKDIDKTYLKVKLNEMAKNGVEQYGKELKQKYNDLINGQGFSISISLEGEPDLGFITDDYFSFVVGIRGKVEITGNGRREIITVNVKQKFAFKRETENKDYVEKQWFETDSIEFFPSFSVSKLSCDTVSEHKAEARDRFERITRFAPGSSSGSDKVIKWYFSKQTPADVRNFGRLAVEYWNKAFQEAGKDSNYKIRVVLDESTDRELGDIRYNIINLIVSTDSEGGALGYGPRIANPITGEILSATANVWVTNIIDSYITLVRKYIRFHVYPPSWKLLPESPGVSDFIHEKIQKLCSSGDSDVMGFIADNRKEKGENFHPDEIKLQDGDIIKECAGKMAEVAILNILLHEMGHCFGYRHVFSASADKDNFYKSYDEIRKIFGENILEDSTESYSAPAQFSSLMDYGAFQYPGLTVPGKYDIAVTKFLYFDKIDLVDGGTLDIPAGADSNPEAPQKDIISIAKEKGLSIGEENTRNGKKVKQYRVCGGESIKRHGLNSELDSTDPLCARFDYGITPLEVVNNRIRTIQDALMLHGRRYDSENLSVINRVDMRQIQKLYNKWKEQLDNLMKLENVDIKKYSFLDEEDIREYLGLIEAKRDVDKEFRLYDEIRQPIFDFFKKIFFLPVKHCVYLRKDGTYQAMALDMIREKIKGTSPEGAVLMNCKSPAAEEWAEENNKGELVTEVGFLSGMKSYLLHLEDTTLLDEGSVFGGPLWAIMVSPMMSLLKDDPYFMKEWVIKSMDTFLNGMDLNPYLHEQLPRFLSYEIEQATAVSRGLPLLMMKQLFVGNYIGSVLNQSALSEEQKREVNEKYGFMVVLNLGQWLRNVSEGDFSILKVTLPNVYEEYKKHDVGGTASLLDFLIEHPAVCVSDNSSKILIPYNMSKNESGNYTNDYAKMCKKFNEYKTCVANHKTEACEYKEDKEAYIQFIKQGWFSSRR